MVPRPRFAGQASQRARRVASLAVAAALLAPALLAAGCDGDSELGRTEPLPPPRTETAAPEDGRASPARSPGGPRLRTVATGLETPWELAFLPDGRALVTERPGRVRLLSRDLRLRRRPVARVDVVAEGEGGLLGLAVDPGFERSRRVYLYRTTAGGNEVARYRLEEGRLREEAVVLDGIAASTIHDGGRIHFGPDGLLYATTGDAGNEALAQDPGSLNGKLLRIDPSRDRARPEIVSLGHRNPQGLDWQPGGGRLVATEHGPDGDDEVNVIEEGANYGWPEVRGTDHGGFRAPLAVYEETIAPSGATFVSLPGSAWTGDYLIAALAGRQIRRLSLDGARVTRDAALFEGGLGRLRTVVEGPDGALYALTSNRDGRGAPREGDDRIVRIVPPAG